MSFERVSKKKLDRIMKTLITINACPKCLHNADIIIKMPAYGRTSAEVRCNHCGNMVDTCVLHSQYTSDKTIATPTTFKSLTRAIFRITNEWNKQTREIN